MLFNCVICITNDLKLFAYIVFLSPDATSICYLILYTCVKAGLIIILFYGIC